MMTVTRRDWWLGIAAIILAIVVHALFPRYIVHFGPGAAARRVDRWTGHVGFVTHDPPPLAVKSAEPLDGAPR